LSNFDGISILYQVFFGLRVLSRQLLLEYLLVVHNSSIIFAAIFFVSLGVIADFTTLTHNLDWFLVVLTIDAIITKVVGGIPAKFFKMFGKDSLIIGFGMVPRGEVAMMSPISGYNRVLSNREFMLS
jgi:Kef-type K+ transport system membrane component KefB